MTRTGKGTLLAGGKGMVGLAATTVIVMACGPGTPAPPLTADGSVDAAQVCSGPGINYDSDNGKVAAIAVVGGDTVRGEILPESLSHRISYDDLKVGRVIARVRLLTAGTYSRFGLQDTMPACWFVDGDYPDSLFSTIYGFNGKVLVPRSAFHAKHGFHGTFPWYILHVLHAEAHWDPVQPKVTGLHLGPSDLRADIPDSTTRQKTSAQPQEVVLATGQSSCTHKGCCPQ